MHDDRDVGLGPTEKAERLAQEVCEGRLSRREFITRAAALGLGVSAIGTLLAACGTTSTSSTTASASPTPLDTTLPKKLFIYNWSDYSSQKVYDDFQKQYGIRVVESFYDGNETLNTKLRAGAGGYDVVFPTDKWLSINAKSGLIQPLHMDLIPNFAKYVTQPLFKAPPFDDPAKQSGKKYSVPYMFGTTGIGIRATRCQASTPSTPGASSWDLGLEAADLDARRAGRVHQRRPYVPGVSGQLDRPEPDRRRHQQARRAEAARAQYTSTVDKREMIQGVPLVHCWDGDAAAAMKDIGQANCATCCPRRLHAVDGRHRHPHDGAQPVRGAPLPQLHPRSRERRGGGQLHRLPAGRRGGHAVRHRPRAEGDAAHEGSPGEGPATQDLGAFEQMYQDAWAKVKAPDLI